jgi:hypothetical protein
LTDLGVRSSASFSDLKFSMCSRVIRSSGVCPKNGNRWFLSAPFFAATSEGLLAFWAYVRKRASNSARVGVGFFS